MKKWILIGLVLLMFEEMALAEGYDFRKTTWGMNKNTVLKIETLARVKSADGGLRYSTSLSGLDCFVFYEFINDKLYLAGYFFNETHINNLKYIDNFYEIKTLLDKKYGEYTGETEKAKTDNKYLLADKGLALELGYLQLISNWETSTTKIGLIVSSNDSGIGMAVFYQSKKLEDEAKQIKQEKEIEKL
jgi:hypothetical protein